MSRYVPEPFQPTDPKLSALTTYLLRELQRVGDSIGAIDSVILQKRFRAPDHVKDGMIVLADGTSWDPGSGAGFYGYNAGWVFLG